MRRVWLLALFAAGARAEESPPTPEAINHAIDAGVAWLKSAQKEDGSFGPCTSGSFVGIGAPGWRVGPTAFAIFTLAKCGVPRDDAAIERGLDWLRKAATRDYEYGCYESSAMILMLTALNGSEAPKRLVRTESRLKPPKGSRFVAADWRWIDVCMEHLTSCLGRTGGSGYVCDTEETGYADISATQFAFLALRAASFAGYPVPDVWGGAVEFHVTLQDPSGGFPYRAPFKPSRGMTAAALSTLLICGEQMALLREKEPPLLAATIERGFKYLDADFDVAANPSPHFESSDAYHYCHLYAIQSAGVLSGRGQIGGEDWYARGAAFLLKWQGGKGQWTDTTCTNPQDVLGTCFALLFLKKATIPVVTPGR